jgi:hypothetical protein
MLFLELTLFLTSGRALLRSMPYSCVLTIFYEILGIKSYKVMAATHMDCY